MSIQGSYIHAHNTFCWLLSAQYQVTLRLYLANTHMERNWVLHSCMIWAQSGNKAGLFCLSIPKNKSGKDVQLTSYSARVVSCHYIHKAWMVCCQADPGLILQLMEKTSSSVRWSELGTRQEFTQLPKCKLKTEVLTTRLSLSKLLL